MRTNRVIAGSVLLALGAALVVGHVRAAGSAQVAVDPAAASAPIPRRPA
ncbi:MAG: hypothetical protein ACLPSH_19540 [Vulcanimicrobiaceae bacterium]